MKYIKGMDVKHTPVKVPAFDSEFTLTDEQLREMGYKPYEEVVYEQSDALNGVEQDEKELKQELVDSMTVVYPAGGLPFKLGYKWVPKIVNNTIIFENVRDANAVGTDKNPILFVEYVKLVPNAFYFYNEERYVYVGLRTDNAGSWDEVSADMEQF